MSSRSARRSGGTGRDSELAKARAEWFRLRTLERKTELMPAGFLDEAIDTLASTVLVALSLSALLHPTNIPERRQCEVVINQERRELAAKALRRASMEEAALAASKPSGDG
jgi:hypothetical protein